MGFAAVVKSRFGFHPLGRRCRELVRIGAVLDRAETAEIDRGRPAVGEGAGVEVVGARYGQRQVAVLAGEIEADRGVAELLLGLEIIGQTGARQRERQNRPQAAR
jgi:hypothetical protein